jgi:hypothetical protein
MSNSDQNRQPATNRPGSSADGRVPYHDERHQVMDAHAAEEAAE